MPPPKNISSSNSLPSPNRFLTPCIPLFAPHVPYNSFILANSLSSSFQYTGPAIP